MSNKQNIFQKIKAWTKHSKKKKKCKIDSLESTLLLNAVIKNQELIPIYKKANAPLKSILKNNDKSEQKDGNLNVENCKSKNSKENIKKEFLKKNTMGDAKHSNDINRKFHKTAELVANRPVHRNINRSLEQDQIEKYNKNLKHQSHLYSMGTDKLNNKIIADLKKNSSVSLEATLMDNSEVSLIKDSIHCKKSHGNFNGSPFHRLRTKVDTFSMMNLFQKDNSFIFNRKAAIKRFEKLKSGASLAKRRKKMTNLSNNLNINLINTKHETFRIIMDNTLEKYSSHCCLDVSSLLNEEKSNLNLQNRQQRKRENSDLFVMSNNNSLAGCSSASNEVDSSSSSPLLQITQTACPISRPSLNNITPSMDPTFSSSLLSTTLTDSNGTDHMSSLPDIPSAKKKKIN